MQFLEVLLSLTNALLNLYYGDVVSGVLHGTDFFLDRHLEVFQSEKKQPPPFILCARENPLICHENGEPFESEEFDI